LLTVAVAAAAVAAAAVAVEEVVLALRKKAEAVEACHNHLFT
jgi:hypothetical protein